MSLTLSNLGNKSKARKRLGRGNASGRGTYCTRGLKGQRSRSGGKGGLKLKGFKQNLLNLPKFKGMKSYRPNNQVVKLSQIVKLFDNEAKINPGTLQEKGIIDKSSKPAKILVDNLEMKLTKKFEVVGVLVSKNAREILEKSGTTIIDLDTAPKKKTDNKEEKVEASKTKTKK
jgi:large subunit ribosomal protein L15